MLKSGMWELFSAVENMEQAILFHIPAKCPASHAPTCQAIALKEQLAKDKGKENVEVVGNMP